MDRLGAGFAPAASSAPAGAARTKAAKVETLRSAT
jgi:hypothetical protein